MIDQEKEELLVTFADIKLLYKKHKNVLKKCALFSGLLALVFFAFKPPLYKATATFRQSTAQSDQGTNLKSILQAVGAGEVTRSAAPLMHSQKLGRPVVEKLGLQISVHEKGLISKLLSNFWGNLAADFGCGKKGPASFVFRDVVYEGRSDLNLYLRIPEEGIFEILDEKKHLISVSKIGERFTYKNISFSLVKARKRVSKKKIYSLKIKPWEEVLKRHIAHFKVAPQKQDKNLLVLTYADPDPRQAAQFLNAMMASYHHYLKQENDELASAQLAYLDKRQAELTSSLDLVLDEQSNYMKENLGKDGFVGLKEEVEMLTIPKQAYTSKLFDLEVEQKRLEGKTNARLPAAPLLHNDQERYQEQLSQLTLEEVGLRASTLSESELAQIDKEIEETSHFLIRVKNGEELPLDFSLLKDPKSLARMWVDEIKKAKSETASEPGSNVSSKEGELIRYLSSHLELLSARKRAVEENLSLRSSFNQELQGINLSTAQNLYVSYQNQLDAIQSKVRQLLYLRDQIHAPDFEVSSLGSLLEDAVGQSIVQKAADIALQLRDQKNRSIKEILRLKEALEMEKTFLIHHIDQTIELDKLRTKLVEERIGSLQKICLDLIHKEKQLVQEKLAEISVKMEDLPEKWKLENHLRFKKELSMGVIEGISKIVETKNLHYNLFYVDSKPIDAAYPPKRPQPSRLFLMLFSVGLSSASLLFVFYLIRGIAKGFAVSVESLMHYGLTVCGKLSIFAGAPLKELGDEDLETLRKLSSFITENRQQGASQRTSLCVALVGGNSLDCASNLAELLGLEGKRILLIQSAFDRPVTPDQIPGLWHYLEAKIPTPPLQKRRSFDFIPTGGTSRHASELLSRASFKQLLDQAKTKYDIILINSTAKPTFSEAHLFLKYADALIVMTSDEKIDELSPYTRWSHEKGKSTLALVVGSM